MITLKNLTNNTETVVKPTIFPDGTSQVWKLPEDVIYSDEINAYEIIWHYENDGEILQVLQAAQLVTEKGGHRGVGLVMPFLPYGRQDKDTSNETTFGLSTLFRVLRSFPFRYIKTFDAHSLRYFDPELKRHSLPVDKYIEEAQVVSNCDLVCFPDAGATKRGYKLGFGEYFDMSPTPSFNLDKKRNQLTGVIEGLVCSLPLNLSDKTILIVDDLADGSKTFIEAAKLLYGMGAAHVDLYVTHGIFSKGIHIVHELGNIRNIYTTDSILRNRELSEKHPNLTVFRLEF